MRVFDSNTGVELNEGIVYRNVNGTRTVEQINSRLLTPTITLFRHETQDRVTIPLLVRWMHPSHLFQRVAFVPS